MLLLVLLLLLLLVPPAGIKYHTHPPDLPLVLLVPPFLSTNQRRLLLSYIPP